MVAASATTNRIAPYLSEPAKTLPLPASAEARSALLADAVFAAVLALQAQLTHHDPAVVQKAANMILDFEKTRLRHGRAVAGTAPPSPLAPLPTPDPLPATSPADAAREGSPSSLEQVDRAGRILFDALDSDDALDDPQPELDPARVEQVRRRLQAIADGRGDGEVVTQEKAEAVYRYIVENDIRPDSFPAEPPPSPARPGTGREPPAAGRRNMEG